MSPDAVLCSVAACSCTEGDAQKLLLLICEMNKLLCLSFFLFGHTCAISSAQVPNPHDKLPEPFTAQANYMSLFGYLHYKYRSLPEDKSTIQLTGTAWSSGKRRIPGTAYWLTLKFEDEGKLQYQFANGSFYPASWKIKTDMVYIRTHPLGWERSYVEFYGIIRENKMYGSRRILPYPIHESWDVEKRQSPSS